MSVIEETYDPGPVKKRRAATLATAVVAGIAGIALAAGGFAFMQDGTASAKAYTNQQAGVVDASALTLVDLPWSGFGYPGNVEDTPHAPNAPCGNCSTATPPATVATASFTLINRDIAKRSVVRLIDVVPVGPDTLYSDVWVRISREDPTLGGGNPTVIYFGSLANLRNVYMGDIVANGTQTFDVEAWTATPHVKADSTVFKVNYSQLEKSEAP